MFTVGIYAFSQNRISGIIVNQENQKPIKDVSVKVNESEVKTDKSGFFELKNLPEGKLAILIYSDEFEPINETFELSANEDKDLGTFVLRAKGAVSEDLEGISEVDLDFDDGNSGQYISGILQSSSDVFVSTAGFVLSYAFFKMRGYDSEYTDIYMNGILMNDAENERASFSDWGGLNDLTRNKEIAPGISSSEFAFGNIGGSTNINTRASLIRKQNKLTYSYTNRSYRQRLMYTYSTGLMKNNLAVALNVSRRWAEEGYIPGTFYDQWAYSLAVEKKINKKHSIAFTGIASPSRKGMQAAATQEVYDLMDTKYYNPNWGYQDGKMRNAKVKTNNQPFAILTHYFTPNQKLSLNTSIGYTNGKDGYTSLNWFNAADPRPDYYRYLPSYKPNGIAPDPAITALITENWKTDETTSQINWDEFYYYNYLLSLEGKPANYTVENRIDQQKQLSFNSLFRYYLNDLITLTGGISYRKYKGRHYKVMEDLLDITGNSYWIDIDKYALRDSSDENFAQNDINNPNKIIKEGDKFGYDYEILNNFAQMWAQADFNFNKFDVYVGGKASYTEFWRNGYMKNGRAPENSYGKSAKVNFTNYGIKAGVTYKISGRHYIVANAAYITNPPNSRTSYLAPRIKDNLVKNLESEIIKTGDINYVARFPRFKTRVTLFQTYIDNQITSESFFLDNALFGNSGSFVNFISQDIDKSHQGIEIGADLKATSTISFNGVIAYGDHRYISRPNVTVTYENGMNPDSSYQTYLKNFYVTGTPQIAGSFGIKYMHPKYWFFNANVNYFGKSYLSFNPDRRTEEATKGLGEGDPLIAIITEPEKLPDGYTVDLSLGKSLKYKKYYFNINFSVSNILNNRGIITGGYEQKRFSYDDHDVTKFPPKYFYGKGRTYYLNFSVRF